MKIRKSVQTAMSQLGIEKLRRNQLKPINSILDGNDTMVIAPTSFGKSLIYQIPAVIHKELITIVIEPLLALMHDQVGKLKKLSVDAAYLDSTQSSKDRQKVIEQLRNREVRILYISPERLGTGILSLIEEFTQIGMIVIDECHCVTAWGYTFRDNYLSIGKYIDSLSQRPVIVAMSATALPEERKEITELLSMRDVKCYEMSLYRSNLCFMKKFTPTRTEQKKVLRKCMKKYHKNTTIVFCSTKHAVEHVANYLDSLYPDEVIAYHSESKKHDRELLSGKKHIIVATGALSMGVDVRNVDLVIHFNIPLSLADYYQMSGRVGREGQHSRSILLYNSDDYYTNRAILNDTDNKVARKRALSKLNEMKEFCEDDTQCMVTYLLNALGDPHKKQCRYCTNCQRER